MGSQDNPKILGDVAVFTNASIRIVSKYKYDAELGIWRLSKVLPLGAIFPYDFGFIPSTKGEDGDPVDVLVLTDESSFVGCVLPVLLIGVIEASQTQDGKTVRNDRLIGVVETSHNPPPVRSLDELPGSQVSEIEHFFISYNAAAGKKFEVLQRGGSNRAAELVATALVK